ncbi:MAG: PKD domain-containing protein [Flavobacteriales bacterium]|jgi:gliding motility-associated-like protein
MNAAANPMSPTIIEYNLHGPTRYAPGVDHEPLGLLGTRTKPEPSRTAGTLLLLMAFLLCVGAHGQLQNNQWRFGFNSAINFNTSPPTYPAGAALPTIEPPLLEGILIEGSASIADRSTGELLFYTDGFTVWNALDQPMPNGSDLGGSDLLSSYMAAVIVPVPGGCTKYYIFCIDDYENGSDGITYSVVDMSLDGGLGDVVPGQKGLPLYDNESELLLAYPKSTGDGYWLITNGADLDNPAVAAFEITALGVNPVPVLSPVNGNGSGRLNYQGTRFACASTIVTDISEFLGFNLYDFDAANGQLSNPVNVPFVAPGEVLQYFEFTFSGDHFYAGGNYALYRFDLTSNDPAAIAASGELLPVGNQTEPHGAAQAGPDGDLYYVVGDQVLRIEEPDDPVAIGPITELPAEVRPSYCLPQWIHLLPTDIPLGAIEQTGDSCFQTTQQFTVSDAASVTSIAWDFGDPGTGSNNTSNLIAPAHAYSAPGSFNVTAIVTTACGIDSLLLSIELVDCALACDADFTAADTCTASPILFSIASDESVLSASWDFGDPASGQANTSDLIAPTHVFSAAGTYEVSVIVTQACGVDTVARSLTLVNCDSIQAQCAVHVPNVFTPNLDGVNDGFSPSIACPLETYELIIYNRWGEMVFRSTRPEEKWDGQRGGINCPDGVYYYMVAYEFPRQQARGAQGHVTLLR